MNHEYCAEYKDILLRPLHSYDIEFFRQWRNKREINQYLSPIDFISEEMQKRWYEQYVKNKDILFFTLDYKQIRTVGSIALYNFQTNTCQIGKVLIGNPEMRRRGLGYGAFLLAMCIGIQKLGIQYFLLSVHENNKPALNLYQKIGFEQNGKHPAQNGGNEWEMYLNKNNFVTLNEPTKNVWLYKENDSVKSKFNFRGG